MINAKINLAIIKAKRAKGRDNEHSVVSRAYGQNKALVVGKFKAG